MDTKRRSAGGDVIRWIHAHCTHTAAEWRGKPFRTMQWQREVIFGMFELDDAGRRVNRWAYVSVPKKNGKTELMAALALWFLLASGEPAPLVVVAAGSDDQADIAFGAIKAMVEMSPTLSRVCKVWEDEITAESIPGGKIQRVAASARRHGSTLDGKNVFVAICDELHVWEGTQGEIVHGTITRGTGARREPFVIQITTAGYDRDSICYRQYELAQKVLAGSPDAPPRYFAWIREAPEGAAHDDPAVWEAANPSFGVTVQPEFYREQLGLQPENEFRRFFLNQWTRSAVSWLPPGAWDRCEGDASIPDGAEVFVGLDVALYHDSTAAVVCWPRPDGKTVVRAKVWVPTEQQTDVAEVMQHVRELALQFKVHRVVYDPKYFDVPAAQLMDEGIPMLEFPQVAARMIPACGYAYEQIVAGNIVHGGDPVLTDHILSAQQRMSEGGWRLSKGKSTRHIDAAIAMCMALHESAQPAAAELTPFVAWL